jgi:hypothetical protein
MWSGCRRLVAVSTFETATGGHEEQMRFIHLFLVGYFILILGVGLALWQTGVLNRVAPIWLGIGAIVAVGLGIMLAVSSGKPTVTEELQK